MPLLMCSPFLSGMHKASGTAGFAAHLREDKASQDEVGWRPALYVHGYEPVGRAQAHSQLPLHAFLQHPHLRLQGCQCSALCEMCLHKQYIEQHVRVCPPNDPAPPAMPCPFMSRVTHKAQDTDRERVLSAMRVQYGSQQDQAPSSDSTAGCLPA